MVERGRRTPDPRDPRINLGPVIYGHIITANDRGRDERPDRLTIYQIKMATGREGGGGLGLWIHLIKSL